MPLRPVGGSPNLARHAQEELRGRDGKAAREHRCSVAALVTPSWDQGVSGLAAHCFLRAEEPSQKNKMLALTSCFFGTTDWKEDWKLSQLVSSTSIHFTRMQLLWPECFVDPSSREHMTRSFLPQKSNPLPNCKGKIIPAFLPHSSQHTPSNHSNHRR